MRCVDSKKYTKKNTSNRRVCVLWFSQIVKTIKISRWSYCFFFLFSSLLYHVCVCLVCRWQRTAPVRARRKTHKHPAGLLVTRERERERGHIILFVASLVRLPLLDADCHTTYWRETPTKTSDLRTQISSISYLSFLNTSRPSLTVPKKTTHNFRQYMSIHHRDIHTTATRSIYECL